MPALSQTIRAFAAETLSPAARSAMLAEHARQALANVQASGRAGLVYRRIVDGVADAPEEAVRGDGSGRILYRFSYQAEAAAWALAFLKARSPARTGAFRDSFYFGVDGRFVPAGSFNPGSVPLDAEITIGNTEPYSRRIDVQMDGAQVLRFSVPSGLFDDCVRAVRREFGGLVKARRVYSLSFPGQYVLRRGARRGQRVQSPAIVLTAAA